MSTNPVLVPVSLLSQFLANEKMASRHWLQCQMECLLDQVFDQLSTKFEDYLASNAITGTAHHTTIHSGAIQHQLRHEHQHELPYQTHSHPQFQANIDHFISSELPVNNFVFEQSQNVVGYRAVDQVNPDEIASPMSHQTTYNQSQYPPSLSAPTSNPEPTNQNEFENEDECGLDVENNDDQLQNDDDTARVDSDNPEDRTEFDITNNQLITTEQMSQNNTSLSASSSNEQSNHNLTNREDEDEDECDCDECRNEIEVKEEDKDQNDNVQFIEDNGPSRPAKVPRIDTTESNRQALVPRKSTILNQTDQFDNEQTETTVEADDDNVQTIEDKEDELSLTKRNQRMDTTQQSLVTKQSSKLVISNPTEQVQYNIEPNDETDETNEVNNKDKLFITIRRQCHHTGCTLMFNNKTELNHHMSTQHDILSFRCVVKDCKQSFSNQDNLSKHLKQAHLSTTQWHCDKCPKHFSRYRLLSTHNLKYHQPGQYKCTFPDCSFMGGFKQQVYDHYTHLHIVEITCDHPNCGRRFNNTSNFKRHQRAHLGIRPYRCKWPSCGYAATQKPNTIAHIRRNHLKQSLTETSLVDPRQYLEVVR